MVNHETLRDFQYSKISAGAFVHYKIEIFYKSTQYL